MKEWIVFVYSNLPYLLKGDFQDPPIPMTLHAAGLQAKLYQEQARRFLPWSPTYGVFNVRTKDHIPALLL